MDTTSVTHGNRPAHIEGRRTNSASKQWLSTRIWGIDWEQHFPVLTANGYSLELSDFDTVAHFLKEHYREIFQADLDEGSFLHSEMNAAKGRFYREAADFIVFKKNGSIVGTFVGNPSDWSSYYLRNIAILPEHQGKKIHQTFLDHFIALISSYVDRVEAEVSPSNLAQVHTLNKEGFNIVGLQLSERWGSNVRMTKFVNRNHQKVFLSQFCTGVKPQLAQQQPDRIGNC